MSHVIFLTIAPSQCHVETSPFPPQNVQMRLEMEAAMRPAEDPNANKYVTPFIY